MLMNYSPYTMPVTTALGGFAQVGHYHPKHPPIWRLLLLVSTLLIGFTTPARAVVSTSPTPPKSISSFPTCESVMETFSKRLTAAKYTAVRGPSGPTWQSVLLVAAPDISQSKSYYIVKSLTEQWNGVFPSGFRPEVIGGCTGKDNRVLYYVIFSGIIKGKAI